MSKRQRENDKRNPTQVEQTVWWQFVKIVGKCIGWHANNKLTEGPLILSVFQPTQKIFR